MLTEKQRSYLSRNFDARTLRDIPVYLLRYTVTNDGTEYRVTNSLIPSVVTRLKNDSSYTTYTAQHALKDHEDAITAYILDLQIAQSSEWIKIQDYFGWNLPKTLWHRLTKNNSKPSGRYYNGILRTYFSYSRNNPIDADNYERTVNIISNDVVELVAKSLWMAEGLHTVTRSDDSYSQWTETLSWEQVDHESYLVQAREKLNIPTAPIYAEKVTNKEHLKVISILLNWAEDHPTEYTKLKLGFYEKLDKEAAIASEEVSD
jgi:hypothetical protein